MRQVIAPVISNKQILRELERPKTRTILGSWLIWLKCPEIVQKAKPGRFVMVKYGPDCVLPRPFSIHQISGEGIALFFAVWEGGKGTNWLSQRQKGDLVEIIGPLGNGFLIHSTSHNLLLVAGGSGIAPLYYLAQQALDTGHSVTLLRGTSGACKPSGEPNPVQHYPEELLPSGIKIETITTSPDGMRGMVIDLIPKHANWADQIFACGPVSMYRDMAFRKKELKLEGKPVQVSLEVIMGCGRGVCYGCTVKTRSGLKQVCKDGPVFELDDIFFTEDLQITGALV